MFELQKIEKTENGYIVCDFTEMRHRRDSTTNRWASKWSFELEFEGITMNGEEVGGVLDNKQDWNYQRVKRAKSRHLEALKENLGLKPLKESREMPIYTLDKNVYGQLEPISEKEGIIHPKTVEFYSFREKKHNVFHATVTSEREKMVEEYNQKLDEFLQYQKEMFAQIFGDDQVENWKPHSVFKID